VGANQSLRSSRKQLRRHQGQVDIAAAITVARRVLCCLVSWNLWR
jgi:hypothetical protein